MSFSPPARLLARPITPLPSKRSARLAAPRSTDCRVDFVADHNRRYPGESLAFFVRVQLHTPVDAASLEVLLPAGLAYQRFRRVRSPQATAPLLRTIEGDTYLVWNLEQAAPAGTVYEYEIETLVEPTPTDRLLPARAVFTARAGGDGERFSDEESAEIAVSAQGAYLRFLPALFSRDELLGRLLMLFESFWKPVDQQISQLHYLFDPAVAPADMLPWLASWLDLVLDPSWPERYRRDLLHSARRLYAKRGTKVGLEEYLETYTGGDVQIIEHRADNFRLRQKAELGEGIALGEGNHPHTFTVRLGLPPDQLESEEDRMRWQRTVRGIIDSEKPAHTAYALYIEERAED